MPPPAHDPDVARPPASRPETRSADHLPISGARDLLDWLEGQGIAAEQVVVEDDGTMTVRWAA